MRTCVDLHNFLQSHDVPHEISLIEIPARTADMAAVTLGLDKSEVGKTLIVEADDNPIVIVIPGSRRLDTRKLRKVLGANKIKLMNAEEAISATGYVAGSFPPLAHAEKMQIYVDLRLLRVPVIYTCGGQSNAVLKIRPVDLIEAGNAQIVDIADDGRV